MDSSNQSWDAQNKKIINVGDPTNPKDAANKGWVDTQFDNAERGSTTAAQKWTFTGDNTTTAFTFSPTINLNEDTAYAVAIDGVMQEPTAAYAIDASTNTITFTSAPPTSSNVVVIARGYSVPVTSGAGTVTSVTAGNGLSGGTITSSGTVSIPTSGGDLNINSGKVGIAGDADSAFTAKITGDLLISDTGGTGNNAHLTLENTHSTDGQAIIKASAPGDAVLQLKDTATTGTDDAIYNVASASGKFVVASVNDAETTTTTLMQLDPTGGVKFDQLPTSDPNVAGELWNDGGVVSVSGSSGFTGNGIYTSSLSAGEGYTYFSNGMVMQWGKLTNVSLNQTYHTVTWPTAFGVACDNVTASIHRDSVITGTVATLIKSITTTGCEIAGDQDTNTSTGDIHWQAIGRSNAQ